MNRPVITFLSDYGLEDEFVGICHGVMAMICPEANVIDLSHGIHRHDVRAGALILESAMAYVPSGVHLAVVDPDVGAERRAVALRTADGRVLVGPDNGLLWPAAERAGGIIEAVDIARSPLRLEPLSATFHGRDIFAPVAAHLAAGNSLAESGEPCDPQDLVALELPLAHHVDGALVASVIYVDRFGNVQLSASHEDLGPAGLRLGRPVMIERDAEEAVEATYVRTFADVPAGRLLVYEDSARRLAVAVSHGSAAGVLRLRVGDELWIRPR